MNGGGLMWPIWCSVINEIETCFSISNKTPTKYYESLYAKFGVKAYHDGGHYGKGTSLYLIDVGLTNSKAKNVHMRHVTGPKKPAAPERPTKANHGAFVASIVGLHANESSDGISGICPLAQIYAADVASPNGTIYTSSLIAAIRDAIELSVDIISISLGTSVYSQPLENTVKEAMARGILVFAASGNCSCRAYEFPAACDGAISVASMDLDRNPSPFNTRNDSVAIFAPGHNIEVDGTKLSGTSFAVPFASGLAALEISRRKAVPNGPKLARAEAISVLRSTLGLKDSHSYSNDIWSSRGGGSFKEPSLKDHLSVVLVFNVVTGALALFMFGLSKGRESCSVRKFK